MVLRHPLGWIGRAKRRQCAEQLAAKLGESLGSDDSKRSHTAIVTDKAQLGAFRARPFGTSVSSQLQKLTRRINRDLQLTGHRVMVEIDHERRAGRVLHLGVKATRLPGSQAASRPTPAHTPVSS